MQALQNLTLLLPLAFLLGICIGSFVTMASFRLPHGFDIVFKPSYCPSCNTSLTVPDLFPLLSWALQRGRCRHCQTAIPLRYPLIELALGLTFVWIAARYGATLDALLLMLLATWLAILIVTDLEHFIIPDSMQIAIGLTGIAWRCYHDNDPLDMLYGAAGGLALGLSLRYGFLWLRKKDGLGWADVKFLGVAGLWLPLGSFVSFLFFAGVFGTVFGLLWRVIRKENGIFPFGPALAASLFICVQWPELLQNLLQQY
jgi:prepilin signal peptidase PulO-like enzyme (type II secretory pathway)